MTNCPFCQNKALLHFRSRDYNRKISKEIFNHYRCPECNLIFIFPVPGNLGDYYPETYYSVPLSHEDLEAISKSEQYKIEIVQRFIKGRGRLLEIGPAYGGFAYLAKKAGFEVEAIEMDARCCKFLNDVVGIHAINSNDICEALKHVKSYDVITLWHVIEHLTDPWITLEILSKKLSPGGIIVIAAPNPNAFQFRILGKYWTHVDAPRHLILIPAPLIIKKMELLDVKNVLSTTTDKGSLGWNRFGWERFLTNACTLQFMQIFLRIMGWIVSVLVSPIERIEGLGCAYTLVFKKEK